MKNIIVDTILYGKMQENIGVLSPRAKKLVGKVSDSYDDLIINLNPTQKELLEIFTNNLENSHLAETENYFKEGFICGFKIATEVLEDVSAKN
ncbi:MAG: hypothetical protein R3Y45_04725 [Bacillota bacterium]